MVRLLGREGEQPGAGGAFRQGARAKVAPGIMPEVVEGVYPKSY